MSVLLCCTVPLYNMSAQDKQMWIIEKVFMKGSYSMHEYIQLTLKEFKLRDVIIFHTFPQTR